MHIDPSLVARLVSEQFPRWASLPIEPVDPNGWDNRTFRLGEELSVRLPSAERYSLQVKKEQRWLPRLGPLLPLPIPVPLAMGHPAAGYPWHWSISGWIDGESATTGAIEDRVRFAKTLASFLSALQKIDPAGGPQPGPHNFFRGGSLANYDDETRHAIEELGDEIDPVRVTRLWEAALRAAPPARAVWLHGDVHPSNLLVNGGRLRAVIDFGLVGVGDPACDLTMTWTFFTGVSRDAFRAALPVDLAMSARARGWALWKALITLVEYHGKEASEAATARRTIEALLADAESAT